MMTDAGVEDDEPDPMIITCQGAPFCDLTSAAPDMADRMASCRWYIREIVHGPGDSTVIQPGRC